MAISVLAQRDKLGTGEGRLLIDGTWSEGSGTDRWTHIHPSTHEEVGTFPVATPADVDAAVTAARRAFDDGPWPHLKAQERIAILRRVADLIREHRDELNRFIAIDNGIPISFGDLAYAVSIDFVADAFDHHAGWVDKLGGRTLPAYQGSDKLLLELREPVGVVAAIVPWNAPLMLSAQKLAPALAAGCTVVLKPSEYATFSVLRLVELLEEAGVPDGVVNVVTGPGESTGQALLDHPGVDKISFTGSREVGRKVLHASEDGFKRVSLELGGKSPLLVFPDAHDVGAAAATVMGMVTFGVSGQGCVCHTRALVHRDVYDEFLATAEGMAGIIVYGDPFDETTNAGPIINDRQLERVMDLIDRAQDEGARLVTGGDRPDGDLAQGNFVNPTVFADVDNDSTIAQEEVFGPVLSIVPFDDEDEAVRLANDVRYGLGATVYTSDVARAMRLARAIRAGTFGINGYNVEPHVPFGGFKQSGIGREGGQAAVEGYTEIKTVMVPTTDAGVM